MPIFVCITAHLVFCPEKWLEKLLCILLTHTDTFVSHY